MADKDIRMLVKAILDYLEWLKSGENHIGRRISWHNDQVLIDFLIFSINKEIAWEQMFTFDTLKAFRKYTYLSKVSQVLISLSQYLYENSRIPQPLEIPNYQVALPDLYEQYLLYREQNQQAPSRHAKRIRRVLVPFHDYLERGNIKLSVLKIEHLDAFMAEFNKGFSPVTCKIYRSDLRGFLRYLYDQRILRRDLAPLLRGAPLFGQVKPPKFLRPQEIQKLFSSLKLSTPNRIRTYAMVHLAYTLGLRPVEISSITLDDISFQKRELTLRNRKGNNPITLPLPDDTIKAIAAYILHGRAKTGRRHLFVSSQKSHKPLSSGSVIGYISKAMKEAGLPSSTYWLRHTYAQHLLQTGASIYEIKEMLGHENIQSTQRYLHIHTELMRKVLFDETL